MKHDEREIRIKEDIKSNESIVGQVYDLAGQLGIPVTAAARACIKAGLPRLKKALDRGRK